MSDIRNVTVNITNRTIVRTILWIAASIMAYKFIGQVTHVLTLVFAASFLALALNPVVKWANRRLHIDSRVRATAVSYLMIIAFLSVFFALVIPPLVRQTRIFIKEVPQTVSNFQSQDTSLTRTVRRYHLDKKLSEGSKDFASHYSDYGSRALDTGKRVAEAVGSVLVVLVLTFMMLVEGPNWFDLYFRMLPASKRDHHRALARRMQKAVSGFVNGQVILATVAGIFAFAALEIAGNILNVPSNAAALAGIVAVFGIIPLFGNPLAAIVVILVSLLNSVTLAIVMLIYFIIYYFIENHTFQPYLQSKLNELTPLMVFIAALIGVAFGGILGALVAIPVASAIKILAEDHFGDRLKGDITIADQNKS